MISEYGGLSAQKKFSIWLDEKLNRIDETNCDVCNGKMRSYRTLIKMQKRTLCCSGECLRKASKDLSEKRDEERIGHIITLQEQLLVQKSAYFLDSSYPLDHPKRDVLERLGFKEGIRLLSIRVLT